MLSTYKGDCNIRAGVEREGGEGGERGKKGVEADVGAVGEGRRRRQTEEVEGEGGEMRWREKMEGGSEIQLSP